MTQLEICNAALNLVGEETIDDITDNSKRARILNGNYQRLKRELLNDCFWRCARTRVSLVNNGNTPAFDFTYEYDLPADFIRLYKFHDYNDPYYEIEKGKLLFTESEVKIIYIADIDETAMDVDFTAVFVHKLADFLCYNLIQSNETKARISAEYEAMLNKHRSYDAMSGTPKPFEVVDWIGARV